MKSFFYLAAYGLMFTSALAFTGCSSDDDEGGGAPKADNSYITDAEGNKLLLTQAGNDYFSYNAEGLLTGFGNSYKEGTVTYNPMKVTINHGGDDLYEYNIALNGAGFISSISQSWSNDGESGKGSLNLSYDGSGRLSKVTGSESSTYTEDGRTCKYSGNETIAFTYSGGKLTKVSSTYTGYEDGEKETDTEEYVYEYASDAPANPLGQFSQSLQRDLSLLDEDFGWAFQTGFLGKPSSHFPTSVKETTTYDEDGGTYTNTKTASYSFNSNGTLRSEKYGYNTFSYSYSSTPSASTRATKDVQLRDAEKGSKKHGFFRRHRNK